MHHCGLPLFKRRNRRDETRQIGPIALSFRPLVPIDHLPPGSSNLRRTTAIREAFWRSIGPTDSQTPHDSVSDGIRTMNIRPPLLASLQWVEPRPIVQPVANDSFRESNRRLFFSGRLGLLSLDDRVRKAATKLGIDVMRS